jgi:hypothetical protein
VKAMAAYFVMVKRRGVSPLQLTLLVRAHSRDAAGDLACALAERERGGLFEPKRIRRATEAELRRRALVCDDAA